jgi:hypothetical protein
MDETESLALRVADVMLPGDGRFPSAQASGAGPTLVARLRGEGLLDSLSVAMPNGLPDGPAARDAVAELEAREAKLFADLRKIVFITYYEQPSVLLAIRALGVPINTTPLPEGYPPESFDPETDAPKHRRGRWLRTEEVTSVDLSTLDHLRSPSP